MNATLRSLTFALLLSLCAASCADPAPPIHETAGTRLSRSLVTPFETPERSNANPSTLKPETLAQYNKLLDEFVEPGRLKAAFSTESTLQHLPNLERFFFSTGRTLEMVDIYRDVVDREGPTHYLTPRLAWVYNTLGELALAQRYTDLSLQNRPEDPMGYFVQGYLISRSGSPNAQLVRAVRASWAKALELDPNFQGPLGISNATLRARIKDMDQALQQLEASGNPPQ